MKEIIYYETKTGKKPYIEWYLTLDNTQRLEINKRMTKVIRDLYGDYKQIAPELFELKFHSGLRVYFTESEKTFVILFCGGNKRRQEQDVEIAKGYLKNYKEKK